MLQETFIDEIVFQIIRIIEILAVIFKYCIGYFRLTRFNLYWIYLQPSNINGFLLFNIVKEESIINTFYWIYNTGFTKL